MVITDTFGLPKGVKDPESIKSFLKVLGSVEGQDVFNPLKGPFRGGSMRMSPNTTCTGNKRLKISRQASWRRAWLTGPPLLRAS